MKKNWTRILPLAAAALLVFAAAKYTQREPVTTTLRVSYDRAFAETLPEMMENAQWVVSGRYTGFDSSWNMSRNPNNPQEESGREYTEGRLYRFSVERVYQGGALEGEILVNHWHGETESLRLIGENGKLDAAESQVFVQDPFYVEPELDREYFLFLTRDQVLGYFHAPAQPFSIAITDEGLTALCANFTEDNPCFRQTFPISDSRVLVVEQSRSGLPADVISGMTREALVQQLTAGAGE